MCIIIHLSKLRFDQISCSGRSGTRWQYGVPEWYEIAKRLGTTGLHLFTSIWFKHLI